MEWYLIHLGEQGVAKLNALFSADHYLTESENNWIKVYFKTDKKRVSIADYDTENITVHFETIKTLPAEVQEDIKHRLQNVKGLERIVGRFSD